MMCRAGVGQGGGARSKMEIRKCLDDFLNTLKSVFWMAILYMNIDNTHFELQNCKKKVLVLGTKYRAGGGGGHFLQSPCMRHEVPSGGGRGRAPR